MYGVRYTQKQTNTILIDKNAGEMIRILRVASHTLCAQNVSTIFVLHNAHHHLNYNYLCYGCRHRLHRGRDVDIILERRTNR